MRTKYYSLNIIRIHSKIARRNNRIFAWIQKNLENKVRSWLFSVARHRPSYSSVVIVVLNGCHHRSTSSLVVDRSSSSAVVVITHKTSVSWDWFTIISETFSRSLDLICPHGRRRWSSSVVTVCAHVCASSPFRFVVTSKNWWLMTTHLTISYYYYY